MRGRTKLEAGTRWLIIRNEHFSILSLLKFYSLP